MNQPETVREIDPAAMVRPELRRLSAYHLDRSPCRFKLDQNEMPFDLPAPVKRRALAELVVGIVEQKRRFEALQQALEGNG